VGERLQVPSRLAATMSSHHEAIHIPARSVAAIVARLVDRAARQIEVRNRLVDKILDQERVADDLATVVAASRIWRYRCECIGIDDLAS
jgi:hypothetical protein